MTKTLKGKASIFLADSTQCGAWFVKQEFDFNFICLYSEPMNENQLPSNFTINLFFTLPIAIPTALNSRTAYGRSCRYGGINQGVETKQVNMKHPAVLFNSSLFHSNAHLLMLRTDFIS